MLGVHQSPVSDGASESSTQRVRQIVERAASLLPAQGPITAFVFLNTMQALEDLPFEEAMRRGTRLFGCETYLSEDGYREKLAHGRMTHDDLRIVVEDDLASRTGEAVLLFSRTDEAIVAETTRAELRMAMLEHRLHVGPAEEMRWFVAETDALARFRAEAPAALRQAMIESTRHWVMRDLRMNHASPSGKTHAERFRASLADIWQRFDESSIERWTDATWESVTLQILWRVCRDGVAGLRTHATPRTCYPVRPRELLLGAKTMIVGHA